MKRVFGLVVCSAVLSSWVALPAAAANVAGAEGRWSTVAPMTTARTEIVADPWNGKIYVAGGQTPTVQDSPMFQEFDPATGHWRDLAPMPRGASHPGVAALNGKIYVAGGFAHTVHKDPIDQVLEYDIASGKWRNVAPLSSPRGSISLVAVGGKLHAIGGRTADSKTVATHEIYDPATGKWTMAAPLPVARDHLAAVVASDGLHVFAGRTDATVDNVGLHDVYDAAADKWRALAPMPTPRSSGAAVFYKGLILYYGGECKDAKDRIAYDEFDGYDVKTNSWRALAKPPSALHAQAAAVVGDAAYFLGGSTSCGSDKPLLSVYAFRLP